VVAGYHGTLAIIARLGTEPALSPIQRRTVNDDDFPSTGKQFWSGTAGNILHTVFPFNRIAHHQIAVPPEDIRHFVDDHEYWLRVQCLHKIPDPAILSCDLHPVSHVPRHSGGTSDHVVAFDKRCKGSAIGDPGFLIAWIVRLQGRHAH
jgi:hypothetical protein